MTLSSPSVKAPKPSSWLFAENFSRELEAAGDARALADDMGTTPIGRGTASFLTAVARSINARAVVEIGTGVGVSGIALLRGMAEDGVLTSIDLETEHQQAAREAFADAGFAPRRCRLIAGNALDVLPNLREEAYDLVFIDADKLEYVEYLAQALRLLRHGGTVIVNNALWHDGVADPRNEEDETIIIREMLQAADDEDGLDCALLPVGDGLLMAVRS